MARMVQSFLKFKCNITNDREIPQEHNQKILKTTHTVYVKTFVWEEFYRFPS